MNCLMTTAGMSAAIKAALTTMGPPLSSATTLQPFCDALAQAIVNYIKTNAEVHGTSPSGAVTGTVS